MNEIELRRAYIARMGVVRRDVKLFIRNVGNFELSTGGHFRAGIAGQADVYGWLRHPSKHALPLEIELKNVRTPHTDEQLRWQNLCNLWGVPHLLLRAEKNYARVDVIETWVNLTCAWLDEL